ncbi:unnamed protein product [Meloidogyne enterolobii]|uniref:Uncharacterized protein n=2 Tax=Meloidogyne enterolobii TaxID=390850 RepID=A0ACB0ZAM4_MELEN
MDEIVSKIGRKNNCTFCGVFRRQALDRAALIMKVLKLATGHNADDGAETILMNILRGDLGRLQRGGSNSNLKNSGEDDDELLPRVKPLKYSFEKVRLGWDEYGDFAQWDNRRFGNLLLHWSLEKMRKKC